MASETLCINLHLASVLDRIRSWMETKDAIASQEKKFLYYVLLITPSKKDLYAFSIINFLIRNFL